MCGDRLFVKVGWGGVLLGAAQSIESSFGEARLDILQT